MTRLVDADELRKALRSKCNLKMCLDYKTHLCERCQTNNIVDFIDDFPTVEERLKGEWIKVNPETRGYAEFFRCSVCLSNVQLSYWDKECDYDYCPNCGAEMVGDEE